jgi:hypothetical protein
MALAPLLAPNWWLRHYAKVALGLGAVTLAIIFLILRAAAPLAHGARIRQFHRAGRLAVRRVRRHPHRRQRRGHAAGQRDFFAHRRGLANVLGTTGAAMLLIRPWIRMNQYRVTAHHIVFFIFIVANVGGCLTPIGDPPLFLGYLQGVPFWWVAKNCWPMWAVGVGPSARDVLRRGQNQFCPRPRVRAKRNRKWNPGNLTACPIYFFWPPSSARFLWNVRFFCAKA